MAHIVAFMPAYNEADIIETSLRYLVDQGVFVYVLENWSLDATYDLVAGFVKTGVAAVERFPKDGPPLYHDWMQMLLRMEELAGELDADWYLLQGADEIHLSPWGGINLCDGILQVDRDGFNAIDHTVMTFHPIDDSFVPGSDFHRHFHHFEYSDHPAHHLVINGWKNFGQRVSLAKSGGHDARFDGRRVYPHKFLLKHYPVRSQAHGERKIFNERKPRWAPVNKQKGWHNQYDHIESGHVFLRDPSGLRFFRENNFPSSLDEHGLNLIDWAGLEKTG